MVRAKYITKTRSFSTNEPRSTTSLEPSPSPSPASGSTPTTAIVTATASSTSTASSTAKTFGTLVPNRVFVGGISSTTTESDLHQLFSAFGNVKATKIISDRGGCSKGYGFVTFETEEEAKKLQAEADNIVLKERKLNIAPAIKKQQSIISRPYEMGQPVLNGTIYYHNGIPYTYQNGVAWFHDGSNPQIPPPPPASTNPISPFMIPAINYLPAQQSQQLAAHQQTFNAAANFQAQAAVAAAAVVAASHQGTPPTNGNANNASNISAGGQPQWRWMQTGPALTSTNGTAAQSPTTPVGHIGYSQHQQPQSVSAAVQSTGSGNNASSNHGLAAMAAAAAAAAASTNGSTPSGGGNHHHHATAFIPLEAAFQYFPTATIHPAVPNGSPSPYSVPPPSATPCFSEGSFGISTPPPKTPADSQPWYPLAENIDHSETSSTIIESDISLLNNKPEVESKSGEKKFLPNSKTMNTSYKKSSNYFNNNNNNNGNYKGRSKNEEKKGSIFGGFNKTKGRNGDGVNNIGKQQQKSGNASGCCHVCPTHTNGGSKGGGRGAKNVRLSDIKSPGEEKSPCIPTVISSDKNQPSLLHQQPQQQAQQQMFVYPSHYLQPMTPITPTVEGQIRMSGVIPGTPITPQQWSYPPQYGHFYSPQHNVMSLDLPDPYSCWTTNVHHQHGPMWIQPPSYASGDQFSTTLDSQPQTQSDELPIKEESNDIPGPLDEPPPLEKMSSSPKPLHNLDAHKPFRKVTNSLYKKFNSYNGTVSPISFPYQATSPVSHHSSYQHQQKYPRRGSPLNLMSPVKYRGSSRRSYPDNKSNYSNKTTWFKGGTLTPKSVKPGKHKADQEDVSKSSDSLDFLTPPKTPGRSSEGKESSITEKEDLNNNCEGDKNGGFKDSEIAIDSKLNDLAIA